MSILNSQWKSSDVYIVHIKPNTILTDVLYSYSKYKYNNNYTVYTYAVEIKTFEFNTKET